MFVDTLFVTFLMFGNILLSLLANNNKSLKYGIQIAISPLTIQRLAIEIASPYGYLDYYIKEYYYNKINHERFVNQVIKPLTDDC